MGDSPTDNQQRVAQSAGIAIAYRGLGAKAEAGHLQMGLEALRVPIEPLSEVGHTEDRLGTPEIIITIVVTAAVKAVATATLKYLEDYLRERAKEKDKDLKIQVVVKDPRSQHRKKFLLGLKQVTTQAVISFSENIRQAIAAL
jgi:hypothetical protein